ncbi:reprolysin-like metallopeptidase [Leucothrix pacifica]|uniref:Yeast cell wall synthesis Kre9/Knh1-like N-terminal domain-containing protein n=1 Tax=Leucothrix pacifica TaxID=1247513 RepID=A0A317CMQ8_9GAMM|nr:zinc-dependent metalloprotease family protein [Leucothrix pacifica]PWQ99497.1 hypothetical protein DKW60_05655 [Leucothrix pacifica]
MRKTTISFVLLSAFIMQAAWSADRVINPWQAATSAYAARQSSDAADSRNVSAKQGYRVSADLESFAAEFAVGDDLLVSLPLPDGSTATYQFSRSSVMADELAAKYPQIQTFTAKDIDNPANRGSFDLTPHGFHGMFKHNGEWVFIDPEMRNDTGSYIAYFSKDAEALVGRTADTVLNHSLADHDGEESGSIFSSRPVLGDTLRTYRLAISASAEYTSFHGGTVSDGLAAIATLVSRLNEVFRRDLAVRFVLVANNDEVIYTNRFLDPFSNTDNDINENPAVLNGVIGVNNYDIGHVVNTGGGGAAVLASICSEENKAYGVTGTSYPVTDSFYIDYVAHEIGHQLGANHTFNGTSENCGGLNRNPATAWEPGSGSTIMSYAGICGPQDLQNNSDDFFHSGSIEEMLSHLESATCGVKTGLDNTVPTVDAGDDYVIPANTPFRLVGSAEDANGDSLSYSWDEYDTGAAASSLAEMVDNGNRPLFRSWDLTDTPERYFPRLEDVLTEEGYTTVGESYPTTDRDLTFRLTVRDGEGGVATDETIITVEASAGPFRVTEPTGDSTWLEGEQVAIRWDVAGTDDAPVNCSQVDIALVSNSDVNTLTTIASGTANDGEFDYTVGSLEGTQARLLIGCTDNVFYAVNDGAFALQKIDEEPSVDAASNKSGGGSIPFLNLLILLLTAIIVRRFSTTK